MNSGIKEAVWVQVVKFVLLAASALGYTWDLLHGPYHVVAVAAVAAASILAAVGAKFRVRTFWCVLASAVLIAVGLIGCALTLNTFGAFDIASTINISRIWYYLGIIFGIVFLTRSLSLRYKTAQAVESIVIIGTLVYYFFDHRDFNLQNPRDFADYLYTHGYDPILVYRGMGIGAAFLSILMLLGHAKAGRVVYSVLVLIVLAMLGAWLIENTRIPVNVVDPLGLFSEDEDNESSSGKDDDSDGNNNNNDDENDDENDGGSSSDGDENENSADKNNGKGSGNGDSNSPNPNSPPTPVAVAVFYDEFTPNDGIFHFRQTVLSEYDGNHLVASTVDDDVISSLSTSQALEAVPMQNENLHAKISTSMFLMKEHAQPPQLAMGQKVFPIQNPDPKVFVSAYGVESLGLTMDLTRLIGRSSVPEDWSPEKIDHYLEIPDDPRYQALSDIIVRQIDPRFVGDDIVKAMYIKSWLEKNGYYTMKTKHIDAKDPAASFLFGSLRGYCVHFAHSAVYLLRSQGIAARVAIGYAIDNQMRGTGSAVLILGNQAHAWPEIYVDGVGWVTLEIFPENGDEPPRAFVDQSLESLFGELARDDKSGGKAEIPQDSTFQMPWNTIWFTLLALLIAAVLACYVRKIIIVVNGRRCSRPEEIYRALRCAVLYWAMFGYAWHPYRSIQSFAENTAGPKSATYALTELADGAKLGAELDAEDVSKAKELLDHAIDEAKQKTPLWRRILGYVNPIVRL